MTVRGRLSELSKSAISQEKKILKLYYEQGVKQKDIKEKLGLESSSEVAEVLRRDMITRVENFKSISKESEDYQKSAVEIIKFLKNYRKLDYSSIAAMLELSKETVFKIISDETTGLRNSLSVTEREDRNAEMLRLSKEEGLSVTEIGKRMGLSKQMVSRIFTDMGYKPIRGTRKVQITQKNLPEAVKFIKEDCNAKLRELNDELRKVKSEFASSRQASIKQTIELRCKLLKAVNKLSDSTSEHELKVQQNYLSIVYEQLVRTKSNPPYLSLIKETLDEVNK